MTGTMEGAAQDNLKAGHGVGPVVELATGERGDDVQHAFAVERTTQASNRWRCSSFRLGDWRTSNSSSTRVSVRLTC
ncbi:hypothetical protein [Candidatus Amarolinea dominans]|uniref:hypothetical protein n=1 Tax=Candidatus Amarolinea dominans TaxID=3140696 RepID=UPI0031CC7B17